MNTKTLIICAIISITSFSCRKACSDGCIQCEPETCTDQFGNQTSDPSICAVDICEDRFDTKRQYKLTVKQARANGAKCKCNW